MATKYGSETSHWYKGYISYSTSSTNTTYTVTVGDAGAFCTANSVPTEGNWVVTVSATDKSNIRIPSSGNTYYSVSPQSSKSMIVSSRTFTYNRGTTAKDIYVSAAVYFAYGNVTSTATSDKITIPALASYAISYNGNGHTGGTVPTPQAKYYGTNITLSTSVPTRTGYTFMGWGTSASDTTVDYAPGATYSTNAAVTLYAIWKKDVTLSYALDGGTGGPSAETKSIYNATTSATFTIPATTPTKQYFKFTGWQSGSTTYQPGGQISISADTILTAQWVEDYIPPQYIGTPTAYRTADSTGSTNNGTGSYAKLTFTYTKGSLAGTVFPSPTVTAKYWEHGTSSQNNISGTITDNQDDTYTFSSVFGGSLAPDKLEPDKQYDILITLQDSGYPANTYSTFISTELFTIDVNAEGTSVAFMMVAPSTDDGVIAPDYNIYVESSASSGADYSLVQILETFGWEDTLSKTGFINTTTNEVGSIPANGTPAVNSSYTRTDFIPVKHSRYIVKTAIASTTSSFRIHGYDSSQTWVKQITSFTTEGTEMSVPFDIDSADGIEYLRLSYVKTGIDNTGLFTGVIE